MCICYVPLAVGSKSNNLPFCGCDLLVSLAAGSFFSEPDPSNTNMCSLGVFWTCVFKIHAKANGIGFRPFNQLLPWNLALRNVNR